MVAPWPPMYLIRILLLSNLTANGVQIFRNTYARRHKAGAKALATRLNVAALLDPFDITVRLSMQTR